MTYKQIRDRTLELLDRYSVAGTAVPASYNGQQDVIKRIPALVDDAAMEIATTARKIPAVVDLSLLEGEAFGDCVRYELPEDFFQFKTGDTLVTTGEGHVLHTNRFRIEGRNYLLIPREDVEAGCSCTITYYRYPRLLGDAPEEDAEPDNVPETHFAIPYYAAAFLAFHDDSFLFASLYNKYEDKLRKMSPDVSVDAGAAGDEYGFGGAAGYTV